jgi:hypothetical protein
MGGKDSKTLAPRVPRIFISHSTHDRKFVESELLPTIADQGIESWYSKQDIRGASEWSDRIVSGLRDCEWFLVVMSSRSARSEWVRDEVHWAMENRWERIIPVLIEDFDPLELHLRLIRVQFVDFRGDRGRTQLLQVLEMVRNPAGTRQVAGARPWTNERNAITLISLLGLADWLFWWARGEILQSPVSFVGVFWLSLQFVIGFLYSASGRRHRPVPFYQKFFMFLSSIPSVACLLVVATVIGEGSNKQKFDWMLVGYAINGILSLCLMASLFVFKLRRKRKKISGLSWWDDRSAG